MEKLPRDPDSLHRVVLYTAQRQPFLQGEVKGFAEVAFRNLPHRYPGLRVVEKAIHPDRVEMALDFQRLDEDLSRVLQSFKSEVKNLARKKHPNSDSFWQWTTEEK
jgi:hypothetical protein